MREGNLPLRKLLIIPVCISLISITAPAFARSTGFEGHWELDKHAANDATVPPPEGLNQRIKKKGNDYVVESVFAEPSNGIAPLLYLGIMTTTLRLDANGDSTTNQIGPFMQTSKTKVDGKTMTTDWTATIKGDQVTGQWIRTLSDDGKHMTLAIKESSVQGQNGNATLHFTRK